MYQGTSSDSLFDMLIADGVHVGVEFGESFAQRPKFFLSASQVVIGWHADASERERHFLSTDGSADWLTIAAVDDLRFERSSRLLTSLVLLLPAETSEDDSRARRWLQLPWQSGLLRLEKNQQFSLPLALRRWNDREMTAVVCFYEDSEDFLLESALRLRVADGLDLLFSAGRLIGWSLDEPVRFLGDGQQDILTPSSDHELGRYLGEYLSIISYPRVDGLIDGDLEVRDALIAIRRDLTSGSGDLERRAVVVNCIDRVLAQWYESFGIS